MKKLLEKLLETSKAPDWAIDQIEAYLQEIPEEKADVASVLDFVFSAKPEEAEWNDEIRSAVEAEIKAYGVEEVPYQSKEESEEDLYDEEDEDEWDEQEDFSLEIETPEKKIYPPVEDIEMYRVGYDKWHLVDKGSGEILSEPASKERTEQLLHHIATKVEQ